jgi:hypothetical protein
MIPSRFHRVPFRSLEKLCAAALLAALTACGCEGACGGARYTIGGSISGLSAAGLTLCNNAADGLPVPAAGNFSFARRVAAGSPYAVTVATQPAGQRCTVANGTGTANTNVGNVAVTCTSLAPHTTGGNDGAVTTNSTRTENRWCLARRHSAAAACVRCPRRARRKRAGRPRTGPARP